MIHPMTRQIIKNLDIYFGKCQFKETDGVIDIHKDGKCVEFFVDSNRSIGISNLNRCGFSGTHILERIDLLAMHVKANSIYLDDQSSIPFGDIRLDFGVLNILVKGKSWYNSMGYFQVDYEKEKNVWDIIREYTLLELFKEMKNIPYSQYKAINKGFFTDGMEFFADMNGTHVDEFTYYHLIEELIYYLRSVFDVNTEMKTLMLEMYIVAKSDSILDDDKAKIDYFLLLSSISYITPYTRFPLTKIISV